MIPVWICCKIYYVSYIHHPTPRPKDLSSRIYSVRLTCLISPFKHIWSNDSPELLRRQIFKNWLHWEIRWHRHFFVVGFFAFFALQFIAYIEKSASLRDQMASLISICSSQILNHTQYGTNSYSRFLCSWSIVEIYLTTKRRNWTPFLMLMTIARTTVMLHSDNVIMWYKW